jgi:hypothetical protein
LLLPFLVRSSREIRIRLGRERFPGVKCVIGYLVGGIRRSNRALQFWNVSEDVLVARVAGASQMAVQREFERIAPTPEAPNGTPSVVFQPQLVGGSLT